MVVIAVLNNLFDWGLWDRLRLLIALTTESRIAPLESLLARYPNNEGFRRKLSDSYYELGNLTKATSTFLPLAVSKNASHYEVIHLANLYQDGGRLTEAEEWTRKAIKLAPLIIDYDLMLADILLASGKSKLAIDELVKATRLHTQVIDKLEKSSFTVVDIQTRKPFRVFDPKIFSHYQSLVKLQQKLISIYEDRDKRRLKAVVDDFLD